MKRFLLFILVVNSLLTKTEAQTPDFTSTKLIHNAMHNKAMGNYAQALVQYKAYLRLKHGSKGCYLGMAQCYIKLGDTSKAVPYLRKAVENGSTKGEIIGHTRDLFSSVHNPYLQKVLKYYEVDRAKYYKSLNVELFTQGEVLFAKDQMVRSWRDDESKEMKQHMRDTDYNNTLELIQLIDEHGWSEINKNIPFWFVIFMHGPNQFPELKVKVDSLMLKGVYEGLVDPHTYAYIIDDRRVDSRQPMLYGQLFSPMFRSIENIETVDERRKSIGLNTLKEYLEMLGRGKDLPEGYLEKK